MTVPYYLIAAAVALFGLLVLVFLAVKLRRALRRFGQVRGWLDEYLTDRTGLVRARTAALGIAVAELRAGDLGDSSGPGAPRTIGDSVEREDHRA